MGKWEKIGWFNSPKEFSEVRLTIEKYEDIFSDFDPRPFSERGLSEDFLFEAKRAITARYSDEMVFTIIINEEKRDAKKEEIIQDRLQKYFKKHYELMKKEKKKIINKGTLFTTVGISLMIIATYLLFKFKDLSLIANFFIVLLEPGGWFLFWEGLDLVIFESKKQHLLFNSTRE